MNRRAFVMPVVILLALIVSLAVTVMLNRNTVRRYDVDTGLQSYIDGHRERGIREIIAIWLQFSARQDLEALIGQNDVIFTLDYSGNRRLTVSLINDQTTALIDPAGLTPTQPVADVIDLETQRAIASRTRQALGGSADVFGRTTGPLAVDAVHAPAEVLEAVSLALLQDPELASTYASRLADLRDTTTDLDRSALLNLADDVGIDTEAQTRLIALLTTTPTLWRIRAELTGPRDSTIARYEGLVDIPREDSNSPLLTGSEHTNSWFIQWSRVDDGVGYTPVLGSAGRQGGRS